MSLLKIFTKRKETKKLKLEIFYKETFLKDLDEIKILDLLKHGSVYEMFNEFQNKFVEIVVKNAPYKTLSKRERKLKEKPWITKSILQSIKIKNKYYSNYIKKQPYSGTNDINFIGAKFSKSKRNHLRAFFQENFNNSKKLWMIFFWMIWNDMDDMDDMDDMEWMIFSLVKMVL